MAGLPGRAGAHARPICLKGKLFQESVRRKTVRVIHALCLHCGLKPANRSRGLCNRCYEGKDNVRHLYPPLPSRFNRRGLGHAGDNLPVGEPTDAMPGSEDKIRVLEARVAAGLQLFHPGDRRI